MNYHILSIEETFRLFNTTQNGISSVDAEKLLIQNGPNKLFAHKKKKVYEIFLQQFADFMILVLIAAAVIAGLLGDVFDTIIILVIVFLNALIGFVQEFRADKAIEALRKMVPSNSIVIRDGQIHTIPSANLVIGDLVLLDSGSMIPADIRLTETFSFKTVEASLTGESAPVEKITTPLSEVSLPIGDRLNMAYKGTYATYGRAKGIVVATGMETELGKISAMLQQEQLKTPLQKRLTDFGKKLSIIILLICAAVFAIGFINGENVLLMLLTSISLAVAAIPEALPAVITIALAMGARKMVRQNALIRNLPAVETLGSVTFICTDKTGTLTENKMTVQEIYDGSKNINAREINPAPDNKTLDWLLTAMSISNDVSVSDSSAMIGDPTEVALYNLATELQYKKEKLEITLPRVNEIPFDPERKCMTTIHAYGENYIVISKGAMDVLLDKISASDSDKTKWNSTANTMALQGLRIMAFAMKTISQLPEVLDAEYIENDLTFLGFCGLIDPPRENAKQAVIECKSAGIIPVMITGDHLLTAKVIAGRLGIIESNKDLSITGAELSLLSEEELLNKVETIRVYARVSPGQKLSIVKALQHKGQFVAMTGDGANDAPSLKRADVGIAMGITGTDVSKEAADMILLDDNFATIVSAVKQGRRIFDNIRKFIRFIMTGNSGEIWTIFLAPLLGLPIPLLPVHILWINLVTDGLPGLALASEKAEPRIMNRPPRHPKESIFSKGLGIHVLWVGLLIGIVSLATQAIAIKTGIENWQTMVFTVLCFSQLGHAFAIRSETEFLYKQGLFSNMKLFLAVAITGILQLALIYVPFLNSIFKTAPLTTNELLLTFCLSIIVFHAVEFEKWINSKRKSRTLIKKASVLL